MLKRFGEMLFVLSFMLLMGLLVMPVICMYNNPHLSTWDVFNLWMSKYTFYIPLRWNFWI